LKVGPPTCHLRRLRVSSAAMKKCPWVLVALSVVLTQLPVAGASDEALTTKVKVGEKAPDFTCQALGGDEFALSKLKGKVVVVNFFATWCGPCMMEMPHLEKEVYSKYKDRKDFGLIAIGREHGTAELEKFKREKGYTLPMAPDPKREAYGKYAEKYIPRTFVVGKDGILKLATVGYTEAEFKDLLKTVEAELAR
jgi:peroxiredoxin